MGVLWCFESRSRNWVPVVSCAVLTILCSIFLPAWLQLPYDVICYCTFGGTVIEVHQQFRVDRILWMPSGNRLCWAHHCGHVSGPVEHLCDLYNQKSPTTSSFKEWGMFSPFCSPAVDDNFLCFPDVECCVHHTMCAIFVPLVFMLFHCCLLLVQWPCVQTWQYGLWD